MKAIALLAGCGIAALILLCGCEDEIGEHHDRYISKRCDALIVLDNGDVLAAINSADDTGMWTNWSVDNSPPAPYYDGSIYRYNSFGHLRGTNSFSDNYPFPFFTIDGLKAFTGGDHLLAGTGLGLTTAVLDSYWQYDRAQHWDEEYYFIRLKCTPVSDGMACLYERSADGGDQDHYLLRLNDDGDLISSSSSLNLNFHNARVAGLSNGNTVVVNGTNVTEYAPSCQQVWSGETATIYYGAAGENTNGEPIFFGTIPDTDQNYLVVATRVNGGLFIVQHPIDTQIEAVSAAAPASGTSWLVFCEGEHEGRHALITVYYDGVDSVEVTDNWTPSDTPRALCAATAPGGWVVVGGFRDLGDNRYTSFVRAYGSNGIPAWLQ